MLKRIAGVVAAVVLASCGGGGGDSNEKALFSIWTNTSSGATVDLSTARFGSDNVIVMYPPTAVRCLCYLGIMGTEQSGSFAITGCIVSPYNSSTDRQCRALNTTGNYTNTDAILTLSTGAGVTTYR